jgi:antitoxin component of MazEF toxin-antitoxin module
MRASLRKMGNSSSAIISKPVLARIGIEAEDDLDISLDERRIVLALMQRHPRTGWAEASKRLEGR